MTEDKRRTTKGGGQRTTDNECRRVTEDNVSRHPRSYNNCLPHTHHPLTHIGFRHETIIGRYRLCTRGYPKLRKNMADVALHRPLTDSQLFRDHHICDAGRNQRKNFALARRSRRASGCVMFAVGRLFTARVRATQITRLPQHLPCRQAFHCGDESIDCRCIAVEHAVDAGLEGFDDDTRVSAALSRRQ